MKILFTVVFTFSFLLALGQTRTISVLGSVNNHENSISNNAILKITKYHSRKFTDSLKTKFHLKELGKNINGDEEFLFRRIELEEFESGLSELIGDHFYLEDTYYEFPEHDFRSEDDQALKAIEDAKLTANYIASLINCDVVGILNIDDDINRDEYSDWFTCNSDDLIRMLEKEGFVFFNANLGNYPTELYVKKKSSTYKIWVTFEIEDSKSFKEER